MMREKQINPAVSRLDLNSGINLVEIIVIVPRRPHGSDKTGETPENFLLFRGTVADKIPLSVAACDQPFRGKFPVHPERRNMTDQILFLHFADGKNLVAGLQHISGNGVFEFISDFLIQFHINSSD